MLFLINALKQWLNSPKSSDFGELQGFALRINRAAVYSVDIISRAVKKRELHAKLPLFCEMLTHAPNGKAGTAQNRKRERSERVSRVFVFLHLVNALSEGLR